MSDFTWNYDIHSCLKKLKKKTCFKNILGVSKESIRESDCQLQMEEGRDKENLIEKEDSLAFSPSEVEERNIADCYDEDKDEGDDESGDLYTEIEETEVLRVLQPPPPPPPLPPRQVTLRRFFVILVQGLSLNA